MSSAIGIVAAVIGLVAVLAAAGLLFIVVRRSPSRAAPATPPGVHGGHGRDAAPELAAGEQGGEAGGPAELAQRRLDEAGRAAAPGCRTRKEVEPSGRSGEPPARLAGGLLGHPAGA